MPKAEKKVIARCTWAFFDRGKCAREKFFRSLDALVKAAWTIGSMGAGVLHLRPLIAISSYTGGTSKQ